MTEEVDAILTQVDTVFDAVIDVIDNPVGDGESGRKLAKTATMYDTALDALEDLKKLLLVRATRELPFRWPYPVLQSEVVHGKIKDLIRLDPRP